jgi:hypothetical protein
MLEFNFRRLHHQSGASEAATELVKKARELARSSNRLAVEFLVNSIGVLVTSTRNEAYFADALNYLCAHIFAHANMPKEAAEAIAASHVLPGSGGDALFHDAVAEGVALARAQDEAISRGAPAVALASMPRAASAALTQTLAEITRCPVFRVSLGWFPNYCLVPVWLRRFLRGGGILHDHFGASDFNLGVLRDCGIQRVNVLVRDPRAAATSYAKFLFGAGITGDDLYLFYSEHYIPWLRSWLAADQRGEITVRWIRSADVTSDAKGLRAVLASILSKADQKRFAASIGRAKLVSANVSGGNPDAWRRSASPALRKKMWDLLPHELVDRLELRP